MDCGTEIQKKKKKKIQFQPTYLYKAKNFTPVCFQIGNT